MTTIVKGKKVRKRKFFSLKHLNPYPFVGLLRIKIGFIREYVYKTITRIPKVQFYKKKKKLKILKKP
jgi:hypothetical protein